MSDDQPSGAAEPAVAAVLESKRIVFDCRWLDLGGAGTATRLLLDDLRHAPPPGRWICWGRPEVLEPLLFPGARVGRYDGSPRTLGGQRDLLRIPTGDVALFMHQIRPLRPGRSVTVIYDTIPLRYGGNRVARLSKRLFFVSAARLSTRILVPSEFSRRHVSADLGVSTGRIDVMRLPVDLERASRIGALRDRAETAPVLLYIGRFANHKNLERLCQAFSESDFRRRDGRLCLVGGWKGEVSPLAAWVTRKGYSGIQIRPACSDAELDRLLATSRALILPSLEEGYGLPAFEAAASGLPVAVSPTGAMSDLPSDAAVRLDPGDVGSIRRAIDEVTTRPFTAPRSFGYPRPAATVLRSLALCFGAANQKMESARS